MAKLLFSLDGNSLGEFALNQERITIGRRPSNQIHIDNLAVSGEHAVIVTIGNDSFLEDLNSTNGTIVNGESIKKYVLHHDDVIEFGKYQLQYINPNQSGATHSDGFEKTMMITPVKQTKPDKNAPKTEVSSVEKNVIQTVSAEQEIIAEAEVLKPAPTKQDDTAEKAQETPASENTNNQQAENADTDKISPESSIGQANAAPAIARLQVLNGANAGRDLILNKTMTTLGKPGSQVAVINKRPNGYFITHVGGNSLPVINGQTIGAQAHALNNHDVIELAGTKMEFFLE